MQSSTLPLLPLTSTLAHHPTISHYLRFIASTLGRDKFLRTLQYFARFYAAYLARSYLRLAPKANPSLPPYDLATALRPWNAIKSQFGLTRKAMRLGKNIEHFKAAAVALEGKGAASGDQVLRYCAVGRQLGYAMYLSLDAVTYLDAAGIRPLASAKRLQREAYRAWFTGLLFNTVAGAYTLWRLRQRETEVDESEKEGEGKVIARERKAANLQLLSDVCDLTIPGSALGYANLDERVVGLAGTVSSLIGVWTAWKKTA